MAPLSETKEWSEQKHILGFIATILVVGGYVGGSSASSARSIIPPLLGFEIGARGDQGLPGAIHVGWDGLWSQFLRWCPIYLERSVLD